MNWIFLSIALCVGAAIITCSVRWRTEYRDGTAKDIATKQESQLQAAIDLLQSNPTAAGKPGKGGNP